MAKNTITHHKKDSLATNPI